eukprot:COSAG04_NODE_265_length_18593_cov_4.226776_14_plen_163_part_00
MPAPLVEPPRGIQGVQEEEVHPDLIENIDRFSKKVLQDQLLTLAASVARIDAGLGEPVDAQFSEMTPKDQLASLAGNLSSLATKLESEELFTFEAAEPQAEPQAEAPNPTAEPTPRVEQPEATKALPTEEVDPEIMDSINEHPQKAAGGAAEGVPPRSAARP